MKKWIVAGIVIVVSLAVVTAAIAFVHDGARPPDPIQGEIDVAEIDVSSKIPGRVVRLFVREGDRVQAGQVLAEMSSPELEAKLRDAQSARAAAMAQLEKARHGARREEIEAARENWMRARAAAQFAEKTFGRMSRLERDGVVSAQRRDEAETQWIIARDGADAAKAAYDMAVAGARIEDKQAAEALVGRADAAVAEVSAYLAETKLTAPAAGEVARRNIEQGEMISAGYPVLTLLDPNDVWATFTLREDELAGMTIGAQLRARIPALGTTIPMRIDFIAPQADFATWRATKASGGFDVKTFEVHARPLAPVPRLRAGMSVLVER
jgi:HlyD family secretion protein